MTAKHTPIEYRKVNRDSREFYVSRHNLIGTGIQVYTAWEVANGRTMEFTTVTYVEEQPVQAWLGRVGTQIDHEISAMPIGFDRTQLAGKSNDRAYTLAYHLIEEAFPEVHMLDTTAHMGTLVYTPEV